MRIQHNIAALNSFRNLTNNNSAVSKNLEKLSSGYRINRAGDDAAGLAISEKMRAQITGLETAQKNASDGVSLVQTAEGALTEVHSMLNRMIELADQSANGTYKNEVDRENLQAEMQSLKDEINRISKATNFNGINLLDGSLGGAGNIAGALGVSNTNVVTASTTSGDFADATGALTAGKKITYTVAWVDEAGNEKSTTINFTVNNSKDKLVTDDGTEYAITAGGAKKGELQDAVLAELNKNSDLTSSFKISKSTDALKFESTIAGEGGAKITALGMTSDDTAMNGKVTAGSIKSAVEGKDSYQKLDFSKLTVVGATALDEKDLAKAIFEVDGKKFILADSQTATNDSLANIPSDVTVIKLADAAYDAAADAANVAAEISRVTGMDLEVAASADNTAGIAQHDIIYKGSEVLTSSGKELTLQIGDTADDFNQLSVKVSAMDTASLGIAELDISTQEGAKAADKIIKDAINKVSSTRGDLGAIQNRLEHTINNLSVTSENMTAAESRIRDVDMAKEMMSYTKNNILVQSSQAMLAQANQVPQGVLQLLQ